VLRRWFDWTTCVRAEKFADSILMLLRVGLVFGGETGRTGDRWRCLGKVVGHKWEKVAFGHSLEASRINMAHSEVPVMMGWHG